MKLSYHFFKQLLDTVATPEDIGDTLTMLGFELEEIIDHPKGPVLDLCGMANRGDAFSVLGLCRELLSKENYHPTPLMEWMKKTQERSICPPIEQKKIHIDIQTDNCRRYSYRLFSKIPITPTPEWIKNILEQAGLRSISLLVDLTNYVLLETGHPMHAFDYHKLGSDTLIIRSSKDKERFTLLNNEEVECHSEDILITHPDRVLALGGIMGGLDSEVSDHTTSILLEAAHFCPEAIRNTRTRLGISTDSSYRFERWVDPSSTLLAIERFTMLLTDIVGDGNFEIVETGDEYTNPWVSPEIEVDPERCRVLLGMQIENIQMGSIWRSLGCHVIFKEGYFYVTPPSWRKDIIESIDLVEDIGRVYGYDKVPEIPPRTVLTQGGLNPNDFMESEVIDFLVRAGFIQVINHALRADHALDEPQYEKIHIKNPHSPELSKLRSSLLPSLSDTLLKNGGKHARFFETGKVFYIKNETYVETTHFAGIIQGASNIIDWTNPKRNPYHFYHLKGILASLFKTLNIPVRFDLLRDSDERFHPGRSLDIIVKDQVVGRLGQIHPVMLNQGSLDKNTLFFEVKLDPLPDHRLHIRDYKKLSKNPSIKRDIALVGKKNIPYQEIESIVIAEAGELLEDWVLFDRFEGGSLENDQHSLAISLHLRKQGENMDDKEANQIRDNIVTKLKEIDVQLRS